MAVLSLENVSKSIGSNLVVDSLNMNVNTGEVYGFLGPNGAGKTTTIRMIVGLVRPSKGTIRVMGHDVQRSRAQALALVGTIVENPETYSYLTGRQNLLHYARLASIQERRARMDEVIEIVGLKDRIDEKVKRYSLGMRQRLGLAQALLGNPKLLVLDEPTNGLDPAGMREFRELVRRLAATGMAIFVSSHLLSEIQLMCDRVAILKGGRIIAEQRVADLVDGAIRSASLRVGDNAAALSVLQHQGMLAKQTAEGMITVQISTQEIPLLVRALVKQNVDVFAVEPMKESLEDTFLQLTDDAPGQSAAASVGGGARG